MGFQFRLRARAARAMLDDGKEILALYRMLPRCQRPQVGAMEIVEGACKQGMQRAVAIGPVRASRIMAVTVSSGHAGWNNNAGFVGTSGLCRPYRVIGL